MSKWSIYFQKRFFSTVEYKYYQLCLFILAISAIPIVIKTSFRIEGVKGYPATFLGHIFGGTLDSYNLFILSKAVFILSICLWVFSNKQRLFSIFSALSYLWFSSAVFENSPGAEKHSVHIFPALFLVLSYFYSRYNKKISNMIYKDKESLELPRWGIELIVFIIGISHTWAGISKLTESGVGWINGDSLQIWVYLWGKQNFLNDLVLDYNNFAWASQLLVLVIEIVAIFYFLSKRLRFGLGLLLISFHFINEYMWGWMFLYWCPIIFVLAAENIICKFLRKFSTSLFIYKD